jgi:hypothetical protein
MVKETNDLPPFRHLEINGGTVTHQGQNWLLRLPPTGRTYADAQIDDYGRPHNSFRWRPGVEMRLRARFSHPASALLGTAGFGFWNAPFGDPTVRLSLLPQAVWFFYGSPPTDLPLAPDRPGQGWFASTLDASTGRAIVMAPFAPPVLLLNRIPSIRQRLWPAVQHRLAISYTQLDTDLTTWHDYQLNWRPDGCDFRIDNKTVLQTPHTPHGPLGFVCWLDNQYMVATPLGRFAAGVLPTTQEQWLEIEELLLRGL